LGGKTLFLGADGQFKEGFISPGTYYNQGAWYVISKEERVYLHLGGTQKGFTPRVFKLTKRGGSSPHILGALTFSGYNNSPGKNRLGHLTLSRWVHWKFLYFAGSKNNHNPFIVSPGLSGRFKLCRCGGFPGTSLGCSPTRKHTEQVPRFNQFSGGWPLSKSVDTITPVESFLDRHCSTHFTTDFHTCVGFTTQNLFTSFCDQPPRFFPEKHHYHQFSFGGKNRAFWRGPTHYFSGVGGDNTTTKILEGTPGTFFSYELHSRALAFRRHTLFKSGGGFKQDIFLPVSIKRGV